MGARGRILLVTSNYPRWAGDDTTPFVLDLAKDLQTLGWTVEVLAPHAPGAARSELIGGIAVERFRYLWPASQQTVCYQGGALINLRKSPFNKFKLPALVLVEFFSILRRLLFRKYDVLYTHWVLPQGFTGVLAAKLVPIPHVITVHGGDVFQLKGKWLTRLKRFAFEHSDAVTVNSSATMEVVNQITSNIAVLKKIPMGVSVAPLSSEGLVLSERIRKQYQHGQGPLLVFVGRLVEEKGIADLIDAVKLLRPRYPDIRTLIIGEGQDRTLFEGQVEKLDLSGCIDFLGWVAPDQVSSYLTACDIFIGPSWTEPQGLTFIEAMHAGTPVVATAIEGIMDSVKHEETGLLVGLRSPDEIAEAVSRLINDPVLAEKLTHNAVVYVKKHFSRASSAQAFSDLFEQQMHNH